MFLKHFTFACAAILLAANTTLAHGPQQQITATNGKIVTREILSDVYAPLTTSKKVYVMEALDYRGVWYTRPEIELNPSDHPTAPGQPTYYSGPGLAFGIDQSFSVGSTFSINFTTGLQRWNGVNFDEAGSTELQYFRGGSIGALGELINPSASISTVDGGSSAAMAFPAIASGYDETAHSTARLRFLGDGTAQALGFGTIATEPSDGIYLASLVLSNSDIAIADSDPYYFVMHKGVPWSDVAAAAKSLGAPTSAVQVLGLPEPSALLLGLLGMSGMFAGRRFSP